MTKSQEPIQHALKTAYRELIAALGKPIHQYKSQKVCRRIERFVDALNKNAGGYELERRAALIERLCEPGSHYETARAQALSSHRGEPRKLTVSKWALGGLRKPNGTPLFLAQIDQELEDCKRVLDEGILNLNAFNAHARQAYERWRSACRAVQQESVRLEVDGCWFLLHIYEGGEDRPSERAQLAKAMTQSKMGCANLKSIQQAAVSLVDWVRMSAHPSRPARSTLAWNRLKARSDHALKIRLSEGNAKLPSDLQRALDAAVEVLNDTWAIWWKGEQQNAPLAIVGGRDTWATCMLFLAQRVAEAEAAVASVEEELRTASQGQPLFLGVWTDLPFDLALEIGRTTAETISKLVDLLHSKADVLDRIRDFPDDFAPSQKDWLALHVGLDRAAKEAARRRKVQQRSVRWCTKERKSNNFPTADSASVTSVSQTEVDRKVICTAIPTS